ncbi:NAD(P)-dependent oxidoreductase [Collimonas antrihumi]|uniref:NAD(P)-dependent oxidoreductase n=1 Tax=Collimonas antrihumi TaxID=1940615 RepID=UPI001B8A95A0|nr:NAD(P)-dependent oxidoreductase [Collimonas antrihumi]
MTAPLTIGFVGTGIMGYPMARHLVQAGYHVQAWNRTRQKAQRLGEFGASVVTETRDVVRNADALVCMLSSGPSCDEILLGEHGLIAAMQPGSLLIVMSSIPVETARNQAQQAAARGIAYVDAPVSGGEKGAIEATLAIMAGGTAEAYEQARPLLEKMGRPTHVGPAGSGELAKLVNQMMVANNIASVAEAMLLAECGGADPAKVREALLGGFADSTILRQHALRMISGDFVPGGPARYQVKDTSTAIHFARSVGLDLPMLNKADQLFSDMLESGDGDLDHSGIIRELRRHNHLPA